MKKRMIFTYLGIIALLLTAGISAVLALGPTERVSVASDGTQGNLTSYGYGMSLSDDGRHCAFYSDSNNLLGAGNDTNGVADVFVLDRIAGTTARVNLDSGGNQATGGYSGYPKLSSDGRYVAFVSAATNLIGAGNDTNGFEDIFVRDRQTNTTTRASVDSGGAEANDKSWYPSISADGRYVAFDSPATNLVAGDLNGFRDIFVRDRQNNTTSRVSNNSTGGDGNAVSAAPTISANGRYVAFWSQANNLVAVDTNGFTSDVFVRDLQTNAISIASLSSSGTQGNNPSSTCSISPDGRYVVFQSAATNLVTNDTNGFWDVFVRDLVLNTTERVSVDSSGNQATGDSWLSNTAPCYYISSDGRYVAFWSFATNLVPNDTNSTSDIFVRDRQTNTTTRVSVDSSGNQVLGTSTDPCISANGRFVGFQSTATNLVPNDTNGVIDVFVNTIYVPPAAVTTASVATATGTGTATLTINNGSIQNLTAVAVQNCGCQGSPAIFPHGLFSFTITGLTPGATVVVTITLPNPLPAGSQYWKCINGQWVNCTSYLGSNDGDNVITLTLTDGGPLDADGLVNGTIFDPGGPAVIMGAPEAPRASARAHAPANVSTKYLSVSPQVVSAGQPITITTNAVNSGDEPGSYTVALNINGHLEHSQKVTVSAGGTRPIEFTITKSEPGTYTVDIGGQQSTFTVTGAGGSTAGKAGSMPAGAVIIFVLAGVVLVAGVMVILLRRSA